MRKTGIKQRGIKTKELRNLLNNNSRILVDVENEWVIYKRLKSNPNRLEIENTPRIEMIQVENVNNPDKWEEFTDVNQAVMFFMKKVLAAKTFRKIKRMEDVEPEIIVDLENPKPLMY